MATNEAFGDQENVPDAMPLRRDDLVLEELDGEAILYDPRYGAVHRFNAVTLLVWDLCDGSHTPADIAHRVAQLCEVEPDEALESVQRVIAELSTLDLVQGVPVDAMNKTKVPWWTKASEPVASFVPPTVGPPEELRLSRRELLGSGMGKLIFVAPVISTFFAAGAYASGPSASAAVGTGGCKTIGYSCAINPDCCGEDIGKTKCQAGACCLHNNEGPCSSDADCCDGRSCVATTCQ